jgi:hypothetical protein
MDFSKPTFRGRVTRDAPELFTDAPGKLTAPQIVALLSLHSKQPTRWTAEALAKRFSVAAPLVDVVLRTAAAPYVSLDANAKLYVATASPTASTLARSSGPGMSEEARARYEDAAPAKASSARSRDLVFNEAPSAASNQHGSASLGDEVMTYADYLPRQGRPL